MQVYRDNLAIYQCLLYVRSKVYGALVALRVISSQLDHDFG